MREGGEKNQTISSRGFWTSRTWIMTSLDWYLPGKQNINQIKHFYILIYLIQYSKYSCVYRSCFIVEFGLLPWLCNMMFLISNQKWYNSMEKMSLLKIPLWISLKIVLLRLGVIWNAHAAFYRCPVRRVLCFLGFSFLFD